MYVFTKPGYSQHKQEWENWVNPRRALHFQLDANDKIICFIYRDESSYYQKISPFLGMYLRARSRFDGFSSKKCYVMPLSTRKFDCMNNTELLRKLQNRMIFLILPKILIANLIRKTHIVCISWLNLIKTKRNTHLKYSEEFISPLSWQFKYYFIIII